MEAEILDFKNEEGLFIVETNDKKLDLTKKLIEKNGVTEFIQAEVTKIASTTVELSDEDFEKHEKMIDAIEDNDDVINVYSNVA
jgi:transcriptional/translational regulatory protein YebC/TACO1